jgi:hypothetical protein
MAEWQDSARRQLAGASNLGVTALQDANTISALQKQKLEQQRQAAQLAQLQKAQKSAQEAALVPAKSAVAVNMAQMIPGSGGAAPSGNGTFDSFVKALVGQESGGNYKAVNKSSGAMGKYQIMPGNIASWSKAALGHSVSSQQFLASPQLQDQVARYQLQQYYNKYGAKGAAVAWYAGEGTAKGYVKNPNSAAYNKAQGAYPSINAYALSILKKMGQK